MCVWLTRMLSSSPSAATSSAPLSLGPMHAHARFMVSSIGRSPSTNVAPTYTTHRHRESLGGGSHIW